MQRPTPLSRILRVGILFFLSFLAAVPAMAQTMDSLSINQLKLKVHANGLIGNDTSTSSSNFTEFPTGSGKSVLYSAGLWITGMDVSNLSYNATETYISPSFGDTTTHFYPGPLADQYDEAYQKKYNRIWKIERDSVQYHAQNWWKSGYQMPKMIEEWPAHGDTSNGEAFHLSEFVDVNNNGVYDPENGDRPIMRGDHALYFISNDIRGPVDTGKESPLGIEAHGMLYAWDCPDNEALNNSFMLHYEVINRSQKDYFDVQAGVFSDFDIGCPGNDYIGSDFQRAMLFAYNGTDEDTGCGSLGYGPFPPAFGTSFLKGVQMDKNGMDDSICGAGSKNGSGFNDGVVDNEHYGLTDAYYFLSGVSPQGRPQSTADFVNYTKGYWRDGSSFTFGGGGYDPTGSDPPTDFVFPWDSDPQNCVTNTPHGPWSEDNAGNAPGDKKGVSTSGPVTFNTGDTLELDLAYMAAQELDSTGAHAPLDELKARADTIHHYFDQDSVPCSDGSFTSVEDPRDKDPFEVKVFPNPSQGRFHVELESEAGKEYRYALYSMRGALIDEGDWQGGGKRTLELGDEQRGIYFLRVWNKRRSKVLKLMKR